MAEAVIAAQQTEILRWVTEMADIIGHQRLSSESSRKLFEDHLFEMLVSFDPSVVGQDIMPPEMIVRLARGGPHPAADRAIFRFVDKAMVVDRFQELPMPIREYYRERTSQGYGKMSPTAYKRGTSPILANFSRNVWIAIVMDRVAKRLPGWAPRYGKPKKGRRSLAGLVGEVFGLKHVQIQRIYESDQDIAAKVGEFFLRGYFESFNRPLDGLRLKDFCS